MNKLTLPMKHSVKNIKSNLTSPQDPTTSLQKIERSKEKNFTSRIQSTKFKLWENLHSKWSISNMDQKEKDKRSYNIYQPTTMYGFFAMCIYLPVSGLSWSTWDLWFSLWHVGSLVVVCKLSCSMCDLVLWPRIKPTPPALGA